MLCSYNWLQKNFDKKLPTPEKLEEGIIFHSFEVESVEPAGDDYLLEIKVLPDRAHDCLCHEGIAREIAAIFDLERKMQTLGVDIDNSLNEKLEVRVEEPNLCRRYVACLVEDAEVKESPEWLKRDLETIGQRAINGVVDAANYVMFDIGQPLHAFDADKVVGGITVRLARAGEKMLTLDSKDIALDEETFIIADDQGPLAIAGIKGGKRAEVGPETKRLILEAANFDPVSVRHTSQRLGVRTDASKRFENELTPELAERAMRDFSRLLAEVAGEPTFTHPVDVYGNKLSTKTIMIDADFVSRRLGIKVSDKDIVSILKRLEIETEMVGEKIRVLVPTRRVDIEGPENIVEEVGRIYGYDKIAPALMSGDWEKKAGEDDKRFDIENKLRSALLRAGFTEVYGYTLVAKGDWELAKPLSIDKSRLRTNLTDFFIDRLKFNLPNCLFDEEVIKIFEIGRVHPQAGEKISVAIGFGSSGKVKSARERVEKAVSEAEIALGGFADKWKVTEKEDTLGRKNVFYKVLEIDWSEIENEIDKLPVADLSEYLATGEKKYKKISLYPRAVRDIALFVPAETEVENVSKIIKESAGELLAEDPVLFDDFSKDNKRSLAFRLVFQSDARSLEESEVNEIMKKVGEKAMAEGWEVR